MKKTICDSRHLFAILAFLLSAVVVFCAVHILGEFGSRQKDADAFAELAELAEVHEPDEPHTTVELKTDGDADICVESDVDTPDEPEAPAPTPRHDVGFLISQNSDCLGWLSIEGTAVDYPVMHTPDWPQKYLRMNFNQEYSDSGVPFMDYRCSLDSDNLIIFGHNMKNGTMFAPLTEYLKDGYPTAHPTILLETEDGAHEFTIFVVAAVDKLDPWYSFINAGTEEDFDKAVQKLIQSACYTMGDAPAFGDRLLTLSTCYRGSNSDRLIVVAVQR